MNFYKKGLGILLFCTFFGFSQNMQQGFDDLENGRYTEAKVFFQNILQDYPNNRTAKLCLGRAVGLDGNPSEALNIFSQLSKDYPSDFEIKLNYAEALLWNQQFEKARKYYQNLLDRNTHNFNVNLGYANTLSNLKEYSEALVYIQKALTISPGNPNALISKKYIQLGYANQFLQKQDFEQAIKLLENNLTFFKDDRETLLNMANVYMAQKDYEKAKEIYSLPTNTLKDQVVSLNGLSLVAHLEGKNKNAWNYSKNALQLKKELKDTLAQSQVVVRHTQALIWNKKYRQAQHDISELLDKSPGSTDYLALRAMLHIYKGEFDKSVKTYDQILSIDKRSFDGNLGKANALKGAEQYLQAYESANRTLGFYSNQKDATKLIEELDRQFTPFSETKALYNFDNGDNEAFQLSTRLEIPTNLRFRWTGDYSYRNTENTVTNNSAVAHSFNLGFQYILKPKMEVKVNGGIVNSSSDANDYTEFISQVSLYLKPYKLQNLELGYKRELQNFNADLLSREIVQNHFYANYNIDSNFNLGFYSQYYFTAQNDGNDRNLLFVSLYYKLVEKPYVKIGFNYQNIRFKEQVPTIYFSPERYNAYEIFADILKDENTTDSKQVFYALTGATGFQYVDNEKRQSTYRIQGKLGYKFSDRSKINLYGTHSNIASATAAGFTFTEIGLRFKWYFKEAPKFIKKLKVKEQSFTSN